MVRIFFTSFGVPEIEKCARVCECVRACVVRMGTCLKWWVSVIIVQNNAVYNLFTIILCLFPYGKLLYFYYSNILLLILILFVFPVISYA